MAGMLISFQDYSPVKGIFGSKWVGFNNFIEFFSNYQFFRLIRNTLLLSLYLLVFSFPAPLVLALLINEIRSMAYKRAVQTISYLPHFISLVVICGIITDFTSSSGVINQILSQFGFVPVTFLLRPELFRPIFVVSDIWQHVGWGSIIYLAALAGIDPGLYEAAIIDGAGRWRQMLAITLPSLLPTITILFIMRVGQIMSVGYEKVILLYNPRIYETADIISTYIYRRGLLDANYGLSTAVGAFNSIINFLFVWSANRISSKLSENSLW
jgi:putative aldouronate transport system permease protein